ncbi:DUF4234 domain-containing protein [Salinibacillus xinjiangensis]|uniref:DUF4234 domain-containing protein n=1 Tax=Salinibacillus xinjiangensis TaxID=1229268 RepID=A0A6G1X904_9BACI|nr:DUF4234 domain-containing protein [Salinibacillus xinjiangensis]MRG87385.1 hypothetical protein [Salinibacillus xinjiangensis]
MSQTETVELKKSNIVLVVFLSLITLGIYIGYWFLNRKDSIQTLESKRGVPFKWWVVFTIYLVTAFLLFFTDAVFFTPYGMLIVESVNTIIAYYFLGLLYYSVFRLKEVLESHYEELHLHKVLLFFFHIWYIQFKLNQLKQSSLPLQE